MVCERPTQGSLCWFKQEYFSPCFRLYTLVSSYLQTNSTKANYVANNLPNFLPFRDRRRKIASNCTPERSGPRSCKRFFLKMVHPRPIFHLFSSFQTHITILKTNICEKCYVHPVYGAGIRTHDLRNMSLLS